MSANDSNLSSTGFDYVVAVTQDSINAALKEYLFYNGLPEVILCYIYDNNNNPTSIDYSTLVKNASNTDPFAVPDGTLATDARVQELNQAGFAFAIKARLGLPPGVSPATLAPIVALRPGQSSVTYTLMFSELVATEIIFGPRNSMTWVNQSQPYGTSWTFSGTVDLSFQEAAFTSLPEEAQNQLKDIDSANMFRVQQLYYDLNSSDLEQGFQFDNIPSNSALDAFMTASFVSTYWKALGGAEVLGYGVRHLQSTSLSSLAVTDLSFFAPGVAGTEKAPLALNYLCATNNDTLPATTHAGFGWNWIEPSEVLQYDGVAALNRNTLASYLNDKLLDYAASNCYLPWVRVTYDTAKADVNYQWNMASMTPEQAPQVSYPPSGSTILSYSHSSTDSDQAGLDGAEGKMELSATFDMTLSVQANQIMIFQHLIIWTYIKHLATSDSGNVVDIQITDTYTIGVDDKGQLMATLKNSVPVNNSKKPEANGFLNFWANVQKYSDDAAGWAQKVVATKLTDVPVSLVQNFVFPGGSAFSFADARFSDFQDLVSHITYADVT